MIILGLAVMLVGNILWHGYDQFGLGMIIIIGGVVLLQQGFDKRKKRKKEQKKLRTNVRLQVEMPYNLQQKN